MTPDATERLAAIFIEENLRDRMVSAQGTIQFIDAQIKDVSSQIIASGLLVHVA